MSGWDVRKNVESATSDYLIAAIETAGRKLSAHLVLITKTESFSVRVLALMTYSYPNSNVTPLFFISLPKATQVEYAYVDSYALDGGPETQCMVEPFKLGQYSYSKLGLVKPESSPAKGYVTFPATFKEELPTLDCDTPDRDAIVTHGEQPDSIPHLDKTRIAALAVYVDATGHIAKTYLTHSTGIDVADDEAQAAAVRSTYLPALVHCMPVNGVYLFVAEFDK